MAPRVLVVQHGLDLDDVEQAVAPDGEAALTRLDQEPFDAVFLDLELPPLDGWYVLASLGHLPSRPRLVVRVPERADIARAHALGADLCVLAGTTVHARALTSTWKRHPARTSPRPMTSGVHA